MALDEVFGPATRSVALNIPILGFIIPNMGTKVRSAEEVEPRRGGIAGALFSKVQQSVLGILFGNAHRSFYVNEIISMANVGAGAVHRELKRLELAGLVTVNRVGNQKHFQANSQSPVFDEIQGLVIKTCGLADVIGEALSDVSGQIIAAFVFGSVARGEDSGSSDIDLMVLSEDLSYADLFGALERATGRLGRTVNPTVYSFEEFARRKDQGNEFILKVLEQPKIWIIGGDRDLTIG